MANAISRPRAEIAAIKAAAEQIQEIAWTLREQGFEADVCDVLDAKATEVYTTCSFQDLTGQRTRKVIQVLRYLEGRINATIGIWGLEGAMAAEAAEIERAGAAEELLHGPGRPGFGLEQADVDMVMGPAEVTTMPPPPPPVARPAAPALPEVEHPVAPARPAAEQRPVVVAPPPAGPPRRAEPVARPPEPDPDVELEVELAL